MILATGTDVVCGSVAHLQLWLCWLADADRETTHHPQSASLQGPSYLGIGLFMCWPWRWLSYLVRIVIPLGKSVNLCLYFP